MAKRKSRVTSLVPEPDWKQLSIRTNEQDQKAAYDYALYYVHYEVGAKKTATSLRKWAKKSQLFNDSFLEELSKVTDQWISALGKATYVQEKLGYMPDNYVKNLVDTIPTVVEKFKSFKSKSINDDIPEKEKPKGPVISIQERMRDQMLPLLEKFDLVVDEWMETKDVDVKKFDPYKLILSHEVQVKPAHAKIIKDVYQSDYDELASDDEDIKEGYSHVNKKQLDNLKDIYEKIFGACDAVATEGKVNRRKRKPKAVSKEKVVSKLKFKAKDVDLSIVSVDPIDILDAKVLWVYNTKYRRLGKYVVDEMIGTLGVKGTSVVGFDKVKSVQKTLRKPEEALKEFAKCGKVALRKFLDDINSKPAQLNGRINNDTILLKIE